MRARSLRDKEGVKTGKKNSKYDEKPTKIIEKAQGHFIP
jgi:hypothetical protein